MRDEVSPTVPTEANGDLGQSTYDTINLVAMDTKADVDTQVRIDGNKMNTGTKASNDSHPGQKSDNDAGQESDNDEVDPVTGDMKVDVDPKTYTDNVDNEIENIGKHSKITIYRISNRTVLEKRNFSPKDGHN